MEKLTCVGHSIGGHICGIVADMFKRLFFEFIQNNRRIAPPFKLHDPSMVKSKNDSDDSSYFYSNEHLGDNIHFGLIGIIIGADPAGPYYKDRYQLEIVYVLRHGLSIYTGIIHTNAAIYGSEFLEGDVDYFPDGGVFHSYCAGIIGMIAGKYCNYYLINIIVNVILVWCIYFQQSVRINRPLACIGEHCSTHLQPFDVMIMKC